MKLTREQAVSEHRKMWNWIADKTERTGRKVYKDEYFEFNNIQDPIYMECFCCEYAFGDSWKKNQMCKRCPIDWNSDKYECMCEDSWFGRWRRALNYEDAARYARKIADLPEREDEQVV